MKKRITTLLLVLLFFVPVVWLFARVLRTAPGAVRIGDTKLDPALCAYKVTYRDGSVVEGGDDIEDRTSRSYRGHENEKFLLYSGMEITFGKRPPILLKAVCYDADGNTVWSGDLSDISACPPESVDCAVVIAEFDTSAQNARTRTSATVVYYFE